MYDVLIVINYNIIFYLNLTAMIIISIVLFSHHFYRDKRFSSDDYVFLDLNGLRTNIYYVGFAANDDVGYHFLLRRYYRIPC